MAHRRSRKMIRRKEFYTLCAIACLGVDAAEDYCAQAGSRFMDLQIVNLRKELPDFYHRRENVETGTAPFTPGLNPKLPCHFVKMSKPLTWTLPTIHGNTASASISTRISGEISALTCTIDVAGRMSRKISPCAFPTFSHSAMFVTYMRVRTTSFMPAPAFCNALSMFFKVCTVCAYTSPTPMILPSGPVAVVPETCIYDPTLTARE